MRKMIDVQCESCEVIGEHYCDPAVDALVSEGGGICECGGRVTKVFVAGYAAPVHGDDIPGGLYIKHGLCHKDGTPRRFDSKSEIRRAAKEAGLTWGATTHIPDRGSDKNKHTTKWV